MHSYTNRVLLLTHLKNTKERERYRENEERDREKGYVARGFALKLI